MCGSVSGKSKRPKRGHGHKEILVEDLAVPHIARGLGEHVVPGKEKGNKEEGEACIDVARRAKRSQERARAVKGKHHEKDSEGSKDAP